MIPPAPPDTSADLATPAMLDIDPASAHGEALLDAMARQYGAPLRAAVRHLDRLFLLRSPWAPGLRFVGGQASHAGGVGSLCDRRVFSMSGPTETLEAGLASCIGEGVELLSQIEHAGDVSRSAPLDAVAHELPADISELVRAQLLDAPSLAPKPTTAATARQSLDWMTARRLADNATVVVPADWCVRRSPDRTRLPPNGSPGTGVAAGPDRDWAASRALLEVIERDAVALWWVGGRRGRPIALHDPAMADVATLARVLRQSATSRLDWLLDITTDIGVPCVAALSVDPDGQGLVCGFAARMTLAAAARAAVLENCQMELALILARLKAVAAPSPVADDGDARLLHLARRIDAATCDLLHPHGVPHRHAPPTEGPVLPQIAAALARQDIDAVLVDLTRPEFGLTVVRALAPRLQSMPAKIISRRLQTSSTLTGGGGRFTNGALLF